MPREADKFLKAVADTLAKRAAFICSNPDCRALTIAPSEADEGKFLFIGEAAHIHSASEGGPRDKPQMTPEERKSASNGVFLCSSCATMIDKNNGLDFPAEILRRWKGDHETWVAANLNKRQPAQQQHVMTFNVSSVGQQGGITAGIVNVGPQPRKFDGNIKAQLAQQLAQHLPDKSRKVTVKSPMGDSEADSFAIQITDYLVAQGYTVESLVVVFKGVPPPQSIDPATYTIIIGGNR